MPKVSVIIPFYRVAPFVERCTRSLMEQTLDDVQFIFVDDASPDESRSIIEKTVAEYKRDVILLTHPQNKGLPAARNTGLGYAQGEYIYHCDSDDFLEPTLLEEMYRAAADTSADYVYCDFYLDFGTARRYMKTPDYSSPERMVKEGFLAGQMKYNVWNKLVHRSLYEKEPRVCFPSGHGMGEDMTMIILAMSSRKAARVPKALYHYMKTNTGAFTNTFSSRHLLDIQYNTSRLLAHLDGWETTDKEDYTAYFKLGIKLPFLMTGKYSQYKIWQQWYPEANRFIGKNPYLPARTKWVQLFAKYHLFPLVWLYAIATEKIRYILSK